MKVVELHRYPVKSLGGHDAESLEIEPWGPAGDRRWAVVDEAGRLKTARTLPDMLAVNASSGDHGITLSSDDASALRVERPADGRSVDVDISRVPTAIDAGDEAARFLSRATGCRLRLVWQPDPTVRNVNPANGGLEGESLSLADAGPVLVTTTASLARLQQLVGPSPVLSMERFRPNVVVDGDDPFEEETWSSLRIGDVEFRVQQLCDRCVTTNIAPSTRKRGEEPLRTLRRERSVDGRPMFGIRVVPRSTGTIRVGDTVSPSA